jgi:hypothetical protein
MVDSLLQAGKEIGFPVHHPPRAADANYLERAVGSVGGRVSYPVCHTCVQVYLASSLGGVALRQEGDKHYVHTAQAWLMVYQLQFQPNNVSYISGLWERVSVHQSTRPGTRRQLLGVREVSTQLQGSIH